jgi:O-6-methylguanine DNA methyltransferase
MRGELRVEWTSYASPVGPLTIVEGAAGPLVVDYPARAAAVQWTVRTRGIAPLVEVAEGECAATRGWLDDYFGGRPRRFPFPRYLARWFDVTPAQLAVFRALRRIPLGETRSYDEIARITGLHARQIGQCLAANHLAILIPCHRVVGKDGSLSGYRWGVDRKRALLEKEAK